jgi:hypothetical protein
MDNTAEDRNAEDIEQIIERELAVALREQVKVVEIMQPHRDRESLSENFVDELDAWARHSFAANGFGDY